MKFRLKTRLTSLFIFSGLLPFLIIGIYAWQSASSSLRQSAFDKLVAVRDVYKNQIEHTFEDLLLDTSVMARSDNVVNLFLDLREYHNEMNIGAQDPFDISTDAYQQIYDKHDYFIREYVEKYDHHNMLMVCAAHGHVMYTVERGAEFGSNLSNGPYRDSNLADLWRKVVATQKMSIVDFKPYAPDNNEPAFFLGTPIITRDGEMLGVLAQQLAIDEFNTVIANRKGMGESGEIYMVGPDNRMRSNSFLNPETHSVEASFNGTVEANGVDTKATQMALAGETGIDIIQDYRDTRVLSAFAPVNFLDLRWAIIAEVDYSEAFATAIRLRNVILILGGFIGILIIIVGVTFANSLSNPIAHVANIISSSSAEIAATVRQHEQTATMQSSSVNETTTTMEELNASSRQSANGAQAAADGAREALDVVQNGTKTVRETLDSMSNLREKVNAIASQILQLSEQTTEIQSIIRLVRQLADQTNLLALNAAVEAARAGEHGKGFAVVATEIRKLADESKTAAQRINDLVVSIQKATDATVMVTEEGTKTVEGGIDLVNQTATSFDKVASSVSNSYDSVQQIVLNAQEQAKAIKQVVEAMNTINAGARETATGLAQTKTGIEQLNEASQDLKAIV